MDNYIGKICPFCKMEINDGDAVKVCPKCNVPHHEGCWEENNGCTTFGCSEHHYDERVANHTIKCINCGATLEENQKFCPKCGTAKSEVKKKVCGKCGAELEDGHEFCPKCGQKAGLYIDDNISYAVNQYNENIEKQKDKAKKKPLIVGGIILGIIAFILGVKLVFPTLFMSTDDLLAQGNYQKAYSSAKKDEKADIEAENIIAYICKDVVDSLTDPNSFNLRRAWYDTSEQRVVLLVGANNSFGNVVTNYWYYTYDDEDSEYSVYTTLSDLSEEKTYSWDDTSEKLEKILKNAARSIVRDIISNDSMELKDSSVDNINYLFEEDILDNVELIKDKKNM